jgi:ABC-type amino acid transport substrate-binding protein
MNQAVASRIGVVLGLLLTASAAGAQSTLDRIAESGEFRIGYRTDARPLSYEEDGRPAGYSVAICEHIADQLREELDRPDLDVSFIPVTLANRFDAVASGEVDIECGATTMTLDRMEHVDFTLMTYVTGGSIMSLADSRVAQLGDLDNRRVAVISGTTTDVALRGFLADSGIDARIVEVAGSEAGMAALIDGDVDAFASDQIVLVGDALSAMEGDDELMFQFATELFSYEPYALIVPRDDADFRLVANRAIAELFRSGRYAVLYELWIGASGIEPPPLLLAMYRVQALSD